MEMVERNEGRLQQRTAAGCMNTLDWNQNTQE